MRRVLFMGAATGLVAATLGGCYWLASYQDLTSGLGTTPSDAADDPVLDADMDAGRVEADVQTVAEASAFCPADAGPYVYCMDFDGVDAGALGLGSYRAGASIVTGVDVSPPSSLFVDLFGNASSASYQVSSGIKPRTTTLQFDVNESMVNVWVTLLSITLYEDSTKTGRTLNVVAAPAGQFQVQEYFELADGGNASNGHDDPQLDGGAQAGAWHHVVLSLTADDSKQQYLSGLTVDGYVLESDQPLALSWAQGEAFLGVGVTYGNGGGPQFYFDNVRADFGL
jgi:hypothetical protein